MSETVPSPDSVSLPPNALLGEDAVAVIATEMRKQVGTSHDPAIVDRAEARAREMLTAGGAGKPVIQVFKNGSVRGGYLALPLHVRPQQYFPEDWELAATLVAPDDPPKSRPQEIRYTTDAMFRGESALQLPTLIIGEEAIRRRLGLCKLELLESTPTSEAYGSDIRFLQSLARTGLPFAEFYPIHDEEITRLVASLRKGFFAPDNLEFQVAALEVMAYCQDLTDEQFNELFASLYNQLLPQLPVRPGEGNIGPIVAARGLSACYAPDPELMLGLQATSDIRHAAFMSYLYHDLSQRLDEGQEYEPVVVPLVEVSEPPEPRDLAIFGAAIPRRQHILADIWYLRELEAAGYPVTLAVERDYARMKTGVARILEHALANNDPVERAEAFLALEYLYNLQRVEQRDELYRLLTLRFALTVPFEEPASLRGFVGVAQTMGDLMPNPPCNEQGEPLPQPARTAAMLARIYYARATQLVLREVQSSRPEDDEVELATGA